MSNVPYILRNSSKRYTFKYGFSHIYACRLLKQSFSRCKCKYQMWGTFKSSCKSKNCDIGNKSELAIETCSVNPVSWWSLWVVVIKRNCEDPDLIKTERLMLFHPHLWAKRDRLHFTELGFHYRLKCSKLCCGTPRMDCRRFPATGDVVM